MPKTSSAIALVLSMGVCASSAFSADQSASPVSEGVINADKSDIAVPAVNPDSTGTFGGSTSGVFFGGDAIGATQQSVTAGYELGGAGIASGRAPATGAILTSPARGRPIRFDSGIFIYPSALVGFGRNDNVLGTKNNAAGSNFWTLRPEIVAEFKHAGDRYTLSYVGNYAHYLSSSSDDYNHHELWAAADNYFTTRARLGWGVGYLEKTDARGATDRAVSVEPDRWHAPVVRALGIYGAPGAIGRIELETSWMQKRYENNRGATIASDVDLTMVSGRFFYRVMPKTSLVFEARNTWANYTLSTSTADNSDLRLYAGVTWEATAKTMGSIKFGRAYKSFSDSSRSDSSLMSWEGSLRWSPLTYSTFDLITTKAPVDATGLGNMIVNTGTSLVWNHKWASYISSRVNAGFVNSEYSGVARKDETQNYGIGFFTELGYRTRLGLDWSHTDRSSNQDIYDFKRNVMMTTLEFVL